MSITQAQTVQFADDIVAHDYPRSVMEIDDRWQAAYGDLDPAPAGNAVKHQRQLRPRRHFAEVLVKAFLARLVVVGRHLQRTVRAQLSRFRGEIHRFRG